MQMRLTDQEIAAKKHVEDHMLDTRQTLQNKLEAEIKKL